MALFIELLLMGVGLAMDAFAVSVCKGLGMKKLNKKQAVVIGLYFGGKYKHKAELVGGIILVLLGVRILIQHLSGLA